MVANRIHQQVDRIAELLAFVAAYDPETLENLQSWFGQIAGLARETSQPDVAAVATAATRVVQRLIVEDDAVPCFVTSGTDQEGGSVLADRQETLRREQIRDQLLTELTDMAVEFRLPGDAPAATNLPADRRTLAMA